MILKICLIATCLIIIGLFIMFGFLLKDVKQGRYKVKDSIISQEAEDRYGILYPENTITELKNEIEKVAELLIAGEESNRYTELLRQKAKGDGRIQEINNAISEKVELVKYVNDELKARIKYKDFENEYTLVLCFSIVTAGRVFLKNYFVFKNKIEFAENVSKI